MSGFNLPVPTYPSTRDFVTQNLNTKTEFTCQNNSCGKTLKLLDICTVCPKGHVAHRNCGTNNIKEMWQSPQNGVTASKKFTDQETGTVKEQFLETERFCPCGQRIVAENSHLNSSLYHFSGDMSGDMRESKQENETQAA